VAGRTVSLLPQGSEELAGLGERLASASDSLVKLTPSHLDALSTLYPQAPQTMRARALVIGGEALHAGQIAAWRRHAPQVRLINEYGPTEATVGCVVHEVDAHTGWEGAIPIGRAIANMRAYVLGGDLQPQPAGVIGELYLGGVGLARGYLGRARLTAQRFVPDPFGEGERLYRTGDLARYREDGVLEYVGRCDRQVKIRGHRVELGEIEAALRQHENIAACAVQAIESAHGLALNAYVVERYSSAERLDDTKLRAFLAKLLPSSMIPSQFTMLAALPTTSNGKLDREALIRLHDPVCDHVAPRTRTEAQLARLWGELFGIERVSATAHFMNLGGHSLQAIAMIAALHAQFEIQLPIAAIYEHPVLADLATLLDAAMQNGSRVASAETVQP